MEPKVTQRRQYFAMRIGTSVIIRKALNPPKRIVCTLTIPKLPGSPSLTDTGLPNKGTKLTQACYTGGLVIAVIPLREFNTKVGCPISGAGFTKIEGEYRHHLIRLINRYEGA